VNRTVPGVDARTRTRRMTPLAGAVTRPATAPVAANPTAIRVHGPRSSLAPLGSHVAGWSMSGVGGWLSVLPKVSDAACAPAGAHRATARTARSALIGR
jgi:hypothetical protein